MDRGSTKRAQDVAQRRWGRSWLGSSWALAAVLGLAGCGDDATSSDDDAEDETGDDDDDDATVGDDDDDDDNGTTAGDDDDDATVGDDDDDDDDDATGGSAGTGDSTSGASTGEPEDTGDAESSGGSGDTAGTGGQAISDMPDFVEVGAEIGIDHDHGEYATSPDCVIDSVGPATGGFCLPERMTASTAVGDFDGDGWSDIYMGVRNGPNRLYHNLGDGTFEDVAADLGVADTGVSTGAVFADFDNDGDQDLYVATLGVYQYTLFINDGDGNFEDEAVSRGAAIKTTIQHSPMSVGVADYDLDGWLDLYVTEWKTEAGLSKAPSHSRLLHNLGPEQPGHFEDVTENAGLNQDDVHLIRGDALPGTYTFSPGFVDMDGDDYPDLTIVSDFACSRLYWNNGDGTFTDGTDASGTGIDENGMGSTIADYDGDGDLDWYVAAITIPGQPPENRFYRNEGDRVFTEMADELGIGYGGWGWGTTFTDVENDGDLDLVASAGFYYTSYTSDPTQLWLSDGLGNFSTDIAPDAGIASEGQARSVAAFDFDRDGDQDLLVANNADPVEFYRNDTEVVGDWLEVRAQGSISNRDGYGVKVTLQVEAGGPRQFREIAPLSHYMGHTGNIVHFGLGPGDAPIHSIRVYFPASGIEHIFDEVERNQRLVVEE